MSKVGGLDENYLLAKIMSVGWGFASRKWPGTGQLALCQLVLSQEVGFPSETGMRSTPAGAPRQEESIAVEFLNIGLV